MEKPTNLIYEPIAIVGMGLRFPGGAANPEEFWKLLAEGTDCIVDVPKDRWDWRRFFDKDSDRPGKTHQPQMGFLQVKLDEFDPLFFGMSPREAAILDPQQRLLLEATWEAFEDAGYQEDKLRGSRTGVFIGGFCLDNKIQQLGVLNRDLIGQNTATSSTMVMLSNRISYSFDLRGPSLTIDTACSSALVAAHYACMSIWSGETDMAIAGGVNVMLRPEYPIAMSKGQFLSKHARCKAFDEDAGGYVRGEGVGAVIFKPLSKAIADGDYIYACIRSTGSNQDGATNGITVPNPDAQEALIREVYEKAGIKATDIKFVEAHGTGTKAGDPVELTALNSVLREGRDAGNKVFVGSVKTNIGHLEAAAGIAGIIKSALVVNKRQIPPHLHFKKANPKIDFENISLKVPLKLEQFNDTDKLLASINSFGYGGTNGHMVVEEPPRDYLKSISRNGQQHHRETYLFPISAKSENALKGIAKKYADYLKSNPVNLVDFAHSLAFRRTHHRERMTVVASTREELIEKLTAYVGGEALAGVTVNQITEQPKLVFVFTGMGPQWWAMGHELYEKEPLFRATLDKCDALFKQYSGWSLLEEMFKPEAESQMNETRVAQPGNFFIQAGLFELYKSWGIQPDAVVGHSVGEVPAAYVTGALSLEDAVLVSYHRSRCQQMTAGQGTMLAIGIGEEAAEKLIAENQIGNLSIAAINSFNGVTLAGTRESLEKVSAICTEKGIFNKMLTVEVAYHSYQMDPLKEELFNSLGSVTAKKSHTPLYSTVTGTQMDGSEFGCAYWWENVRQPVRFAKAAQTIVADGYSLFLEVGPHPVLRTNIGELLTAADKRGQSIPSLRRGEPEVATLYNSLGTLHTLGLNINWKPFTENGHFIKLPLYAWDKDVYWQESEKSVEDKHGVPGHIFLNNDMRLAYPSWEVEVNQYFFPWMEDHKIESMTVIPGAAYVEAGLALHHKTFEQGVITLQNLEFHQVFVVDEKKAQMFQTSYNPVTKGYSVYSRNREDINNPKVTYTLHATGRMLKDAISREITTLPVAEIRSRCTQELSAPGLYTTLSNRGLNYGPWFQGIKEIYKGNNEVLVRIQGDDSLMINLDNYLLHPTILDSGFQTMVAIVEEGSKNPSPFVPVMIKEINFFTSPSNECWSYCRITERTDNTITGDLILFDEQGEILVELKGITCQAISSGSGNAGAEMDNWFYGYQWNAGETIAAEDKLNAAGNWIVFGSEEDATIELISALNENGGGGILVTAGEGFETLDENLYTINPANEADYHALFESIGGKGVSNIAYLWSLEKSGKGTDISYVDIVDSTMPAVYIAKAWATNCPTDKIKLNIVTRGAQSVHELDSGSSLETAPFWALNHLIGNENPNIKPKTIDLGLTAEPGEFTSLVSELLSGNTDEDVAIRFGERYIKSLNRKPLLHTTDEQETRLVNTTTPVSLEIGQIGKIDSLHYSEIERTEPAEGQIEIEVHASCLSLKDVLKVIGQLSTKATKGTYFESTFGMEAAGVVTRIGKGVTDFTVGEEIVLSAKEGCLKSYVTATPTFYLKKPKNLAFEDSLMVVPYMTVLYGLRDRAQLQKGEKILIHNGTGGVGLAAIQWAKHVGAEIFATAGSEEKRAYLKNLGVNHVYDSRSLEFIKQIKNDTNGYGIDVVINAIAGEALYQSFELLAAYGRFVEIGKRDITENAGLPMAAFNRNITFHGIDVDRLMIERTPQVQQILRDIEHYYANGIFSATHTHTFAAKDAIEAFNFLAQSKHMGKVVLNFHNQEVEVPVKAETKKLDTESTYLITGGTGGFGLQIAKWLAGKGVKQLVLASRSGAKSEEAKAVVAEIEALGTRVYAQPVDITSKDAVAALIQEIKSTMPPLKGIIHCAVVLDDGFIMDMNRDRFITSFNAKVGGALILDQLTRDIPLDHFVSFSSISALIGNTGQANYVAANGWLDAFAHYRRSQGLAATTVNLGVLTEVGILARDTQVAAVLESGGILGFTNENALNSLGVVMEYNPVQIGMFNMDWKRWAGGNAKSAASSRFAKLVESSGSEGGANNKLLELASELSALSDSEKVAYIENATAEELARVLKLSVEKIDRNRGVNFLGVDSLIAVELGRGLQTRFGVDISTMELLSGPTVVQLTALVMEKANLSAAANSDIDELSEEELDALLAEVKE